MSVIGWIRGAGVAARGRLRGTQREEESKDARVPEEGRASFLVLLASQLLGTTAFMFVVPFMPLYVQALGVEDVGHAAAWAGVINGASGATMALVAPLWGRLSDKMGRKLMLLRATIAAAVVVGDRKSTRLNSSHANISYAVFCLEKKIATLFIFATHKIENMWLHSRTN